MKLSITLTDERVDFSRYNTPETKPRTHTSVSEMESDPVVIAGVIRAIADSLDPRPSFDEYAARFEAVGVTP